MAGENTTRKDAFLNNSYDQSSTHKALLESLQNSYSYLYELQKKEIEYEEFHCFSCNTVDMKKSGYLYVLNGKVYFNIFYNTIHISDREAFYRNTKNPADNSNISGGYTNNQNYKSNKFYYKDEFTFEDMISNDIFKKIPIVIIDDMALYEYKIKFEKDHFRVEVPVDSSFVVENRSDDQYGIYYKEHNIQVLIIPTILCKRTTVTSLSLLNNSLNHYLSVKNNTIKSVLKNNTFASSGIDLSSEISNGTGLVFMMVHLPNADGSYSFGTNFYPLIPGSNDTYTTLVTEQFADKYNKVIESDNRNIKITYIYVKDAHLHKFYYTNNGYNYAIKRGTDDNQKYNLIIPHTKDKTFYNQPIPIENFMIYKANYNINDDGRLSSFSLIKNTEILKLHYPNIYEINCYNSEQNRFYVVYFYSTSVENSRKYENEYKFFYDYIYEKWNRAITEFPLRLESSMTAIFCDTINKSGFTEEEYIEFKEHFDKFMNLSEYTGHDYHIHGYNDNNYMEYVKNNPVNSVRMYEELLFKNVTINEYGVLRDYVREQNKLYHYMYHFDITANDLTSRKRESTSNEYIFDDEMNPYQFDSIHYVFTFNNKSTNRDVKTQIRLYINGLYVGDFKQYRYLYKDYIYIPQKYFIGENHHIELEVYPSYEHVTPLSFSTINETKEVVLLESNDDIYPTVADIYCMTPVKYINQIKDDSISAKDNTILTSDIDIDLPFNDGIPTDGNIVRYNSNVVQITEHYDNDINYNLTPDIDGHRYTRLKKFKITAKKNDILNKTTWFRIAKIPHKIKYVVENEGYQLIEISERNFHFHPDYLRIFINGRLVPKRNYSYTSDYYYPHIYLFEKCKLTDEIYIDISPYRYREVAFFKSLDDYTITTNSGSYIFIDLKEYLNRPFDTETYDVYIDGYRLSSNDMMSYYETGIIIFNSITTHKLEIYEKERDTEYYPKFKSYFSFSDIFNSSYITTANKYNIINKYLSDNGIDTSGHIEDILPEFVEIDNVDYEMIYIFYRMELIKKGFVNPDIRQFNKLYINMDYRLVYDNYIEDTSNMINTTNNQTVLHLNPDKYIEGEENNDLYKVFGVGHLYENLEQEIEQDMINNINTHVIIFDPDLSFNTEG